MPITDPTDIANCELYLDAEAGVFSDAGSTPAAIGATVQQWNDQSGNGRNASQATSGNRPVYVEIQGVGRLLFVSNDYLETPSFLDSSYQTAYTYWCVHEPEQHVFQVIGGDMSGGMRHDAGDDVSSVEKTQYSTSGLSDNTLTSTVSRQSNRLEIFTYNGTTKTLRIVGPDSDTSFSESATGNLGVSGVFRLGIFSGGGFGYRGFVGACGIHKKVFDTTDKDNLAAWYLAKFAANSAGSLSAGAGDVVIVCDGNSLTAGTGSTGGNTYPAQLAALLGAGYATPVNKGVSGKFIGQLNTDKDRTWGEIDALWDTNSSQNIIIYLEGINDVNNGASGENSYQRHKDYGLRRKYKGWQVIVCTCPPATSATGVKETARDNLNTLLRNNWADFADALVDLDLDPAFDDPTDLTYYDADGIHLNNTGYGVVAALVQDAIASLALSSGAARRRRTIICGAAR
jgi:lysophospholipase L1-like esterase